MRHTQKYKIQMSDRPHFEQVLGALINLGFVVGRGRIKTGKHNFTPDYIYINNDDECNKVLFFGVGTEDEEESLLITFDEFINYYHKYF